MKIPRDLKPGDKLWYSQTEFATVGWVSDNGDTRTYERDDEFWHRDILWANSAYGTWLCYENKTGKEIDRNTPPIIRIERSAKPKRAKVSAADRLITIAQRCVPFVNPKALARELTKTRPVADCYLNTLLRRAVKAAQRGRAAARAAAIEAEGEEL